MLPNPILELGPFKVHMYGVMIALGILAAFIILFTYSKKLKISPKFTDFIFYNAIASIVVGFGSAALFQAFYDYIEDPSKGFHITGSITFIGGLIGGAACFLIVYFILRKRLSGRITDSLSIIPCAVTIGHAFGRIGCLFAGCCHGEFLGKDPVTGGIWMRASDTGVWGYYVPTQLYEALFLLVLFGVMSFLVLKFAFRHNMSIYLIGYGIFRFAIEYLRNDHRGELIKGVPISPSQFWSIGMVLLGIGLWVGLYLFEKKKNSAEIAE